MKEGKAARGGWVIAKQRERKEPRAPRVYVSINKRGEIAMNAEAFYEIDEPANVALLYDERQRRIAIKRPVTQDEHFFPVRRYGRGRKMRIVRAARMLKQFDIKVDRTLIFIEPEYDELDDQPMLVLNLDEG